MKRCSNCCKKIDGGLLVCQVCSQENKKLKDTIMRMAEFINELDLDTTICDVQASTNKTCTECINSENCIACIIKHFER